METVMAKNVIEKVLAVIRKEYLSPEIARDIETFFSNPQNLGAYQEPGAFEKSKLSELITNDLRKISKDEHLKLRYAPDEIKVVKEKGNRAAERESLHLRKMEEYRAKNFGFERAEILPGNVGYLKFNRFCDVVHAGETAISAIGFFRNTKALIIDLRENEGGEPTMNQLLMSYFLPDGTEEIARFFYRPTNETKQLWSLAHVPGGKLMMKLYVLTAEKTFSAAEAFAYGLQVRGLATIVGAKTRGGANIGARTIVDDDFMLLLPIGTGVDTKTGKNWEGVGVKPDVETPSEKAFDTAYEMAQKI
jgi:C-terminal processing protease CtpA/Prc